MVWFISTPKTNEATRGKQLRPEFSNAKYDSTVKKHLSFEALSARSSPLKRAPGFDEGKQMFGIGPAARRRVPSRLHGAGGVGGGDALVACVHGEDVRPASGVWIKREPRAVSLTRAAVRAGTNSWRSARRKIAAAKPEARKSGSAGSTAGRTRILPCFLSSKKGHIPTTKEVRAGQSRIGQLARTANSRHPREGLLDPSPNIWGGCRKLAPCPEGDAMRCEDHPHNPNNFSSVDPK